MDRERLAFGTYGSETSDAIILCTKVEPSHIKNRR